MSLSGACWTAASRPRSSWSTTPRPTTLLGTFESLEDPQVHCFYHAVNRGKGAALRTGFAAARNPYVVVQDADLEYDPRDYRHLLEALLDGRADMVYGSRFSAGRIACSSSGTIWATGC